MTDRIFTTDRDETDFCEASTEGCAIDHTAEGFADLGCVGF